jgi:hypothetical protein
MGSAGPAVGADLLASYEPAEVSCLTVSTNPSFSASLAVSWPVKGGVDDVPAATQGEYVLKLEWSAEADRKVEVGHEWSCLSFDLAGADYILADVYFATESSVPGCDQNSVSIRTQWDANEYWMAADCSPTTAGEWHTILIDVSGVDCSDCNTITALIFEQLGAPGDVEGCLYIDNLRLGSGEDVLRRQIRFSRRNWLVKDSGCGTLDPGSNYFSQSKENVWVDENGYLHLKIAERCDKWFCSEVLLDASPGYGRYAFTTQGRLDQLDPNIVLGLFTWDTDAPHHHYREIDVEFSRWGDGNEANNAQYVVQPWDTPGNRHRFQIDCNEQCVTTHEILWDAGRIVFRSYNGDYRRIPLREDMICRWVYSGSDIPPAGGENVHINFWLLPPQDNPSGTAKPSDGQEAEIIIKKFRYLRPLRPSIRIMPRTLNLKSKGRWVTCRIEFDWQYLVTDIDSSSILLEGKIPAHRIQLKGRENVAFVKFSRPKLRRMLSAVGWLGDVKLIVTGRLKDGRGFKGTDTIRVINPGR